MLRPDVDTVTVGRRRTGLTAILLRPEVVAMTAMIGARALRSLARLGGAAPTMRRSFATTRPAFAKEMTVRDALNSALVI